MKQILLVILLFFLFNIGYSQISNKETKTITKAIKLYDKKEYEKAIKKLAPVLETHKYNHKLWEINIEFYHQYYLKTYNSVSFLMDALQSVNEGKSGTNFSVSSDKNFGFDNFISQCYRCTRLIENATTSNVYLRNYLIDVPVDTAISEDAIIAFHNAEREFRNENYSKAIEHYNKALKIEPNYYKASMYLGDCYWKIGKPGKAVGYFNEAVKIQPTLLEPRKYVTDTYFVMAHFEKALTACIDGIIAFPDSDMFRRMSDICYRKDWKFDRHWMPREFEINKINSVQDSVIITPWNYYREAKSKIEAFCDDNGVIIRENSLTKQHYMEAYCWEYMLSKTEDKQFSFAKKAMNGGYLDCFVLVSMYHISLHSQFEDLAKNNTSKIRSYFKLLLITE